MRKALGIGIGATAVAALAMGGISVASASAPVRGDWAAVTAPTSKTSTATGVNVAEARRLAEAAVPGGYGVQIESDDLADRPVWKVTVDGPAGRVTVLVDAASGAATVANRPADSSARRTSAASRSSAPPPAGSADDHRASAGSAIGRRLAGIGADGTDTTTRPATAEPAGPAGSAVGLVAPNWNR